MIRSWKVGIIPQSERNIQLEYRLFQCRNVTLKSYEETEGSLSQSKEKSYRDRSL